MHYIGHFSFEDHLSETEQHFHGYFTCVVDATDMDSALEKLRDLVVSLKRNDKDILGDVREVFLDSCIEIKSVPTAGFLGYFLEWRGEPLGMISSSVRGATGMEVGVCEWVDERARCQVQKRRHDVEPFVRF
jgi:hypothetical protein